MFLKVAEAEIANLDCGWNELFFLSYIFLKFDHFEDFDILI